MKQTGDRIYSIEKGDKIREFDCCILSIDCKGGGGYFTAFPISPKEYRESCGRTMPDKVTVEQDDETTTFIITDDWGHDYEVSIDNVHHVGIEHAKDKAKESGLLTPKSKEE